MKILMVLDHNFPPDSRVEKEIETLTKNGHEVVLACFKYKTLLADFEIYNNYKIYRKTIPTLIYKLSVSALKLPFYFNFWKKFLIKILNHEKIDAIHIHDLPLSEVGVFIKKKYNIPLVIDLHENWPASLENAVHTNTFLGKILSSNKQWREYEKNILKYADAIITVIDEMRNRIANLGISKNKIYIVSNTINPHDFPLYHEKPDSNYTTLFYAGGINIHRGLQTVIKALPSIIKKKPNVRLNIIGKGSYQRTLEKLIEELSVNNYVNFMGWKNFNEISMLLAKSDIALIPHLKSEQTDCSSPNKLYQYIYAQKPILTSNCDSLVRMVSETKSGISYQHNSPEDFERAFFEISENENNVLDIEFGLSLIHKKYNWNADSKRLVELYEKLD